jgi:DNA-binding NarL/FixJ family response regulator
VATSADWDRIETSSVDAERPEPPARSRAPLRRAVGRTSGAMTATDADALRASLGHLTPRQRDIVRLLGQGMSSAAIAAPLGITTSAITSQRARIRRLLGLISEWELTRYAILVPLAAETPMRKSRRR